MWGTLVCWVGTFACTISLAELASINPTVGAQYRWTSLFAPRGVMSPAFWGLLQGWITVLAWITAVAQAPFLVGTLVQGLIALWDETYLVPRWHGTLLAWASLIVPVLCNVFARKLLGPIEIAGGITHIAFWVIWVVVLVTMAPRSSSEYVFATTYNGELFGGWTNSGVSWCVGLLSAAYPLGREYSHARC